MPRQPRIQKRLVIIDPQIDFMGHASGLPFQLKFADGSTYTATLPVAGAVEDMERLCDLIEAKGQEYQNIAVTLDSHHPLQIFHPAYWRDVNGKIPVIDSPTKVFPIFHKDVGKLWFPFNAAYRTNDLTADSRTMTGLDWALYYTETLAANGRAPLTVWTEHCLIGSYGWMIYPRLKKVLDDWARKYGRTVTYKIKGDCMFTEHYGALEAEVQVASVPSTMMDKDFVESWIEDDVIDLVGEASSHCVLNTGEQIVTLLDNNLSKLRLVDDAMSPVPAIPGIADFPAIAESWKQKMVGLGATRVTTPELLAKAA